jgi:hypothetical protein
MSTYQKQNGERRPSDLAKPKSLIKPIESGKIKETT